MNFIFKPFLGLQKKLEQKINVYLKINVRYVILITSRCRYNKKILFSFHVMIHFLKLSAFHVMQSLSNTIDLSKG